MQKNNRILKRKVSGSNNQAEPRRSVLRQNIDKNPSQLVIPPLAPAPLLGFSSV